MGRRVAVLVLLAGCGFDIPGAQPGMPTSDGSIDAPVSIDAPGLACATDWLDLAWPKRYRIQIDQSKITGSHTDVPVLLEMMVPGPGAPKELVFTAADGKTRLSHQLEAFHPGTGRVLAWVKVPQLSSSGSNRLFMYFGNASASPTNDPALVWSNNFTGVWHLGDNPASAPPEVQDSTSGAHHGTIRYGVTLPSQQPGKIGGSLELDGVNDAIDVASVPIGTTFTYEAWILQNAQVSWKCIINNSPAYNRWFGAYDNDLDFFDGAEHLANANMTFNQWAYVAATYDGANLRMYWNGQQVGSPIARTYTAGTNPLQIGYTVGVGEWFYGRLDEVRVSSVARSPEYLLTTYRDQFDPGAFAAPVGAVESCP